MWGFFLVSVAIVVGAIVYMCAPLHFKSTKFDWEHRLQRPPGGAESCRPCSHSILHMIAPGLMHHVIYRAVRCRSVRQ
jgi:hypothetical protein